MAYADSAELETIICDVQLKRAGKGQLNLEDTETERIHALLKAAEQGKDVMKLDISKWCFFVNWTFAIIYESVQLLNEDVDLKGSYCDPFCLSESPSFIMRIP